MNRASVIEVSGLSAWDHKLTVMRLYFCLVLPLLRASGKDKAMKRIPKTPVEFDYDLWTTEDGKCMVRVKLTGEVTELDREVMQILRAEEKKLRRSFTGEASEDGEDGNETVLSLDALPDDDVNSAAWLADPHSVTEEVTMNIMIDSFILTLTEKQAGVFKECMINGRTLSSYAKEIGVDYTTVKEARDSIRKKFKIFFEQTP